MCAPAARGAGRDDAEKAKIAKVVRTSIEWALTKDKPALFDCFAQDSSLFIFNPDQEHDRGLPAFQETHRVRLHGPAVQGRHLGVQRPAHPPLEVRRRRLVLVPARRPQHLGRPARELGRRALDRACWRSARAAGSSCRCTSRWPPTGWRREARGGGELRRLRAGRTSARSRRAATPGAVRARPGLQRGMNERDVAIAPDGGEIYFGVMAGPGRHHHGDAAGGRPLDRAGGGAASPPTCATSTSSRACRPTGSGCSS